MNDREPPSTLAPPPGETSRPWPTNDRTSFGLFVLVVAAGVGLLFRATTLAAILGAVGGAFVLWGLTAQRRQQRRNELRS